MAKSKNTTKFRKPSPAELAAEDADTTETDAAPPEDLNRREGESWDSFSHRLQEGLKAVKKAGKAERKAAGLSMLTGELPEIVKVKMSEAVADILAKSPGKVVRALTVQVRTKTGETTPEITVKTLAIRKPRD